MSDTSPSSLSPDDTSKSRPANIQAAAADDRSRPWWHVLLLYPALLVALIGAIPNYMDKYEAWRKGVEQRELAPAKERNRLITKNMDCMLAPLSWVETATSTKVDATICHKTGDILVRLNWGADQMFMDVVSSDRIRADAEKEKSAGMFVSSALAADLVSRASPVATEQVICQRWLQEGRLLQRLQTPQGCIDQVLNTYRGSVESRQPAPCNTQC